jgi:hypothetical protein
MKGEFAGPVSSTLDHLFDLSRFRSVALSLGRLWKRLTFSLV